MWQSLLSDANKAKLEDLSSAENPQGDSLDDVASRISASSTTESCHEAVLAAVAYLSQPKPEEPASNGQQHLRIVQSLHNGILSQHARLDRQASALIAEAGLACLYLLSSGWSWSLDESSLLTAVAYTDPRDPWTSPQASDVALGLLNAQLTGAKMEAFITNPLLQTFLRPLFSKSSMRITVSGRPSHYQTAAHQPGQYSRIPTWREHNPWALATFKWAVEMSDSSVIQKHWPLYMPVMLSLAEDDEPKVRSRGLEILSLFVQKCPVQVLQTTGIGTIFEEVTFPALLHLPSTAPDDESIQLLVHAYDVLINLAESRQHLQDVHRRRLLDKILRDGIFAGYEHASQHARIAETLFQYATKIINSMGIYSIKHLQVNNGNYISWSALTTFEKNLLSMLSTTMLDPFALTHAPTVLAATEALNALIANCWPRLQDKGCKHIEHIIRIIAICWLSLYDEDSTARLSKDAENSISAELTRSAKMLQSLSTQQNAHPLRGLAGILTQEPRLASLFPPLSME